MNDNKAIVITIGILFGFCAIVLSSSIIGNTINNESLNKIKLIEKQIELYYITNKVIGK